MDLQEGSGSETSEQSLQKLQSETDILAATGGSYDYDDNIDNNIITIWDTGDIGHCAQIIN